MTKFSRREENHSFISFICGAFVLIVALAGLFLGLSLLTALGLISIAIALSIPILRILIEQEK